MSHSRCIGCGGAIELLPYEVPAGVIARGDRLMHEGCVLESRPTTSRETPAYRIPRNW